MSSFTGETKLSPMAENVTMPMFYTNVLPPSMNLPNECFTESVDLTKKGIERNKFNQHTGDEANPFTCKCERVKSYNLGICADCEADLGPIRLAEEQRRAQDVKDEDAAFFGNSTTTTTEEKVDPVKERREKRKRATQSA